MSCSCKDRYDDLQDEIDAIRSEMAQAIRELHGLQGRTHAATPVTYSSTPATSSTNVVVNQIFSGRRHTIVLDDYELANLRELLRACGTWREGELNEQELNDVAGNPFTAANNGLWLSQLYAKLPTTHHAPNMTAAGLARKAWLK